MKKLLFTVKRNINRPPKIYVASADRKTTYGSFTADSFDQFDNWESLSPEETIELKQYMDNMKAIERHFGKKALNEQQDFRIRLPQSYIEAIHEISLICNEANQHIDIYENMINASIQHLKVTTAKLPDDEKQKCLSILNTLGLSDNKKIDASLKIQAVFSELLSIHNKSEKLHQKALELYNKDKSIAPKTIEEIAKGEQETSRWLVSCAIDILIEEKPDIIKKLFSKEDMIHFWINPMESTDISKELIQQRKQKIEYN